MAASSDEKPPIVEMGDKCPGEDETLEKLKKEFKPEEIELVHETDLRRIIRGYHKEKEPWKETVEHTRIWIDALKNGFASEAFDDWEKQGDFEKMQSLCPVGVFGQDKQGHPVIYEDLASAKINEIAKELKIAEKFRLKVFSHLWNKKHNESKDGRYMYKQINVFNMSGIGLWAAKQFKDIIGETIGREQNLFPETVYKMYMINTPWSFKMIWAVVSLFVHKDTQKKISFLGSDYINELKKEIDEDQIPKKYNGTSEGELVWGGSWFKEPVVEAFPELREKIKALNASEKAADSVEKSATES